MSNKKNKVRTITPTELVSKVADPDTVISTSNIRVTTNQEIKEEPVEELVQEEVVENKTIKLANTKSTVVMAQDKVSTAKTVSQSVLFIRNYIDGYLNYVNGTGVKNVKESITKFARIVTYILSHQEDEVLDEVYAFFKKNRKSILTPDIALQGIYYLSANQQDKIQQVYTLFDHITATRKAKKLDMDYASSILGTGNLIAYIAKHMV